MVSLTQPAPVVGCGVDFLTMTCNRQEAIAGLLRWSEGQFRALEDAGYERKSVGQHGYLGEQLGPLSVQFGRRDLLIRVSGEYAGRHWRDLAPRATNISRLDLAVTARTGSDASHLARSSYQTAVRRPPLRGRAPSYTLIQSTKTGDTLYVGRRISDQWGRLYNKELESGDPHYQGCWRYEVELKHKAAYEHAKALLATKAESEIVSGTVYRWFDRRGIRPRFKPGGLTIGDGLPRTVADYPRWRAWVERVVRPRAAKEAAVHGWLEVVLSTVGPPQSRTDVLALLECFDNAPEL